MLLLHLDRPVGLDADEALLRGPDLLVRGGPDRAADRVRIVIDRHGRGAAEAGAAAATAEFVRAVELRRADTRGHVQPTVVGRIVLGNRAVAGAQLFRANVGDRITEK